MEYPHVLAEDFETYSALKAEDERQRVGLELIPSENYVSKAVLEALGSSMTNKYSEGLPGKRYYGGQQNTDKVETLAIERACQLFSCKYANVQPLSGAPANLAAYFALMEPGDTILGMDLSHGGHLTHGHPMTVASKLFRFVTYQMKNPDTGEIDYDGLREVALKEKPKVILAGFSAYSRDLDWNKFRNIALEVNAYLMADIAHIAGLIVGKALANPFDFGFDIVTTTTHKTLRGPRGGMILVRDSEELIKKVNKAVFPGLQGGPHMNNIAAKAIAFKEAQSPAFQTYCKQVLKNAKAMENIFREAGIRMIGGGTDNHLLLLDVQSSFGISGKEAETLLDEVGITLNKNVIAGDTRSPLDPSGIRLGTPAITTRGFNELDCEGVASVIVETLRLRQATNGNNLLIRELATLKPIPDQLLTT